MHLNVKSKFKPMKKLALTLFVLMINFSLVKAEDEKNVVKSEIKDVTIFINGAQINRTASTTIPAGTSYIVFEGLSQYMNTSSVQVKGNGDFVIISVTPQMNYLKSNEKSKEVKTLEDSLESYNSQLTYQQSLLETYTSEKNMIIANQNIGGNQNGVKIDDLKAAADFFRTRLADISSKTIYVNAKIKKIQDLISNTNNQLSSENAKNNNLTSEIIVALTAKAKIAASFEISYAVSNAGWTPSYDLRATDTSSPISLDYSANVYQSSGEDWNNVKLTLSTGNPSVNNTKPTIYPWYLYIYDNYNSYKGGDALMSVETKKDKDEAETSGNGENIPAPLMEAQTPANYTNVNANTTNFEFKIDLPYSIKSDGKTTVVQIQKYSLPATYEYYAAPKLDPKAYLLAKVTGWEEYNLLSGNMNLYFEGTYIGKSYLDVKSTLDTLDFSLGQDENIVITRTKQKEYSSKQLIGNNRKLKNSWEINIRNKKKNSISISIEDQLPLSTDKNIEVEKEIPTDAKYDETNGILTWKYSINSAETKQINFSYTVKYPKDKNVYIE